LNEKGEVVTTSETETTTTLTAVDNDTYTRRVNVTFKVAGKEFTAEPRLITKGLNGEDVGQSVTISEVGPGKLVVDGEEIKSQVRRLVINGGNTKRITTFHYCDSKSPYVFKLETKATDADGKETNYTSKVDVVDVDKPRKVLWQFKNASRIKTVHQRPNGKTVTEEWYSSDIPGGVVSHKSIELDESGRVIRRSTLKLLDYEVAVAREIKTRTRLRDRKRSKKRSN